MLNVPKLARQGIDGPARLQDRPEPQHSVRGRRSHDFPRALAVVIRPWSCVLLVAGAAACADSSGPRTGVTLTDITADCTVSGANLRPVVVADATARVTFAAACGAATGTLVVRVVSNVDFDPNGYSLGVDAAALTFIPAVFPGYERAVMISGLSAGAHGLNISGVAEHCTARPQSPIAFAVSEGTTAQAEVSVTCLTHE